MGFDASLAGGSMTKTVKERVAQVAQADLLLVILGWRLGSAPTFDQGGNGESSWTEYELRSALRRRKPVVVLMASTNWPEKDREAKPHALAELLDLRGEVNSIASSFDLEPVSEAGARTLERFRETVRRELARHHPTVQNGESSPKTELKGIRLRSWPNLDFPDEPFSSLLPCTHPSLLAGRDRDLAKLRRLLRLPMAVLGLHSVAGAGKSSLILGALAPELRAEGQPIAIVRHPTEPEVGRRLVGDLLESSLPGDLRELDVEEGDHRSFVDFLLAAHHLAAAPPILVLDQFERLFRDPGSTVGVARSRRAFAGSLLAASLQRQPGCPGPLCHWVLVYRQEFHGRIVLWLRDVLREARSLGLRDVANLPHDLSGPERFCSWSLPPLGSISGSIEDALETSSRVFLSVIEAPWRLRDREGRPVYTRRLSESGARRLARAFGQTRVAQPQAPLIPEMQIVLALLLSGRESDTLGTHDQLQADPSGAIVDVPDEPSPLIKFALREYVRRSLFAAFPGQDGASQAMRLRALMMLRELAEITWNVEGDCDLEEVIQAIGRDGKKLTDEIERAGARLVVRIKAAQGWTYALAHDSLAEAIRQLVEGSLGRNSFGRAAELWNIRSFVAARAELWACGEVDRATDLSPIHFRSVKQYSSMLLWGPNRRAWWEGCIQRRRVEWRKKALFAGLGFIAVLALLRVSWDWTSQRAARQDLLSKLEASEAAVAFEALGQLLAEEVVDDETLRESLRRRQRPFDMLERGIRSSTYGGERGREVLEVAKVLLPLVDESPADPVRLASLVWALDFFAEPKQEAWALREQALRGLRELRPPPPDPDPDDPEWVRVSSGAFCMGSAPGDGRDDLNMQDEKPKHKVALTEFRILKHEVSNAEYRRLFPEHEGKDVLPASSMTWYEAYVYAAWLGGRLPTEAEWEYAARAKCLHQYCDRNGNKVPLEKVAWWLGSFSSHENREPLPQEPMQLERNPWGLADMYGNAQELVADWYAEYPDEDLINHAGPTSSSNGYRVARGGDVWSTRKWTVATARKAMTPENRFKTYGFRVYFPGSNNEDDSFLIDELAGLDCSSQ